jgi:hypothetical protein
MIPWRYWRVVVESPGMIDPETAENEVAALMMILTTEAGERGAIGQDRKATVTIKIQGGGTVTRKKMNMAEHEMDTEVIEMDRRVAGEDAMRKKTSKGRQCLKSMMNQCYIKSMRVMLLV